jgi:hypothetical protein
VKEDGRAFALPAIQAILRSQIVLAAKGNVQAQRAVLAAIQRPIGCHHEGGPTTPSRAYQQMM